MPEEEKQPATRWMPTPKQETSLVDSSDRSIRGLGDLSSTRGLFSLASPLVMTNLDSNPARKKGMIYFNFGSNEMRLSNGSVWLKFGTVAI